MSFSLRYLLLTTTLLSVFGLSCVQEQSGVVLGDDTTLVIEALRIPERDCSFSTDTVDEPPSPAVLDLALTRSYRAGLLLGNHEPAGRANRILISDMHLTLRDASTGELIAEVSRATPASVDAQSETILQVMALERAQVDALLEESFPAADPEELTLTELSGFERQLEIELQLTGSTLEGRALESPPFVLTLDLCVGCLVQCTTESRGGAENLFCENPEPPAGTPCWLGQDTAFDCRSCVPYLGTSNCRQLCEER